MNLYIDPSKVTLELDGGEGYPQLGVSVDGMFITDAFRTEDGMRSEVEDPEVHYGIPDDFARAMGIINMWFRRWHEEGDMAERRFVCAWSSDGYDDVTPVLADINFFGESNGYRPSDLEGILDLEIGQVWESHDHGLNSHIVYRVK